MIVFVRGQTRPLDAVYEHNRKRNKKAWAFFQAQAPSYQRAVNWWVMSAKQEETRLKRFEALIRDAERGVRLARFVSSGRRSTK